MHLYRKIACTKFSGIVSRASERPKTFRFFQGLRLLPTPSLKKIEHERDEGAGAKRIKTRIERSNFCRFSAVFVFWALLLKIQSATTPSILGVWGSSLDSIMLSHIPFDTMPNNKKWKYKQKIFLDPEQTVRFFFLSVGLPKTFWNSDFVFSCWEISSSDDSSEGDNVVLLSV